MKQVIVLTTPELLEAARRLLAHRGLWRTRVMAEAAIVVDRNQTQESGRMVRAEFVTFDTPAGAEEYRKSGNEKGDEDGKEASDGSSGGKGSQGAPVSGDGVPR